MSKKTVEILVDDLDESPIFEGEGRTVTISIDGRDFQRDLTNEHIAELYTVLSRFIGPIEDNRPSSAATPSKQVLPAQSSRPLAENLNLVREWARRNGHKVNDRGRIPYSIMDAYTKAHLGQPAFSH